MNVRLASPTYPPRHAALGRVVWMLICICLWGLGIILCETVIDHLYFR
jgi:hypothetical protein